MIQLMSRDQVRAYEPDERRQRRRHRCQVRAGAAARPFPTARSSHSARSLFRTRTHKQTGTRSGQETSRVSSNPCNKSFRSCRVSLRRASHMADPRSRLWRNGAPAATESDDHLQEGARSLENARQKIDALSGIRANDTRKKRFAPHSGVAVCGCGSYCHP